MTTWEIICAILCSGLIFYYVFLQPFNFWKNIGVNGPKPVPFFGNLKQVILVQKSLGECLTQIYNAYPEEALVGIYNKRSPILLVKDLDLIKTVLIKDFKYFMDRGIAIHETVEPLSQNLFSLETRRWKPLRMKMSPAFGLGKLKHMFSTIQDCCDELHRYLDDLVDRNEPIEVRELMSKFTTDVIGSCVFGLKMNSMSDDDSEFRKMGRKIFKLTWIRTIKFHIRDNYPRLYRILGPLFHDKKITQFFMQTINKTMQHREKYNITHNDIIDILRDLKQNPAGFGEGVELTDSLLTSQAFVFFVAGFMTSSTTISHMLYELAQNQSIQNKVRNEIRIQLQNRKANLQFEDVKSMEYLHQVFQETLRKYPVVPTLIRESSTSYTFEGTRITIPAKQKIWIPIYSLHHDPNIFSNPDKFDPDRFTDEGKAAMHSMSYLPFGDGPRNCIAQVFAEYQVKSGVSKVLENFRVEVCEQTRIPYVQHPAAVILSPIDGIRLKFVKFNE